jgi:hypothetical protein
MVAVSTEYRANPSFAGLQVAEEGAAEEGLGMVMGCHTSSLPGELHWLGGAGNAASSKAPSAPPLLTPLLLAGLLRLPAVLRLAR